MTNIVIDLSTVQRVLIRPPKTNEVFADAPHFAGPREVHHWVRTPYGNLLYAIGPEQFGALLAMLGAIEFELNNNLRTLLNALLSYDVEGFTIQMDFEETFKSGLIIDPNDQAHPRSRSQYELLDQVAELSARGPKP